MKKVSEPIKNDSRIRVSNKQEKHETIISIYKKYQDNDDKKLIKLLKGQLCNFHSIEGNLVPYIMIYVNLQVGKSIVQYL